MSGQARAVAVLAPDQLTWKSSLAMFELRGKAANHSKKTLDNYAWSLAESVKFFRGLGADGPATVRAPHIQALLESLRSRNLSSHTVFDRFVNLRTFFRALVNDGLLDADPTAKVQRPRVESKPPKAMRPEALLSLLERLDTRKSLDRRHVAVLLMLYDTAARVGELLSLRIRDLDLGRQSAMIRGKGGRFRLIGWGQKAHRALLSWLACRADAKPDDPVFIGIYGDPLTYNAIRCWLKRITKAAGIAAPRLAAHSLRHGAALSLLNAGANLEVLRRKLGHSRLTTTQRYLAAMTDEQAIDQARDIGVVDRMGPLPGESRRVRFK